MSLDAYAHAVHLEAHPGVDPSRPPPEPITHADVWCAVHVPPDVYFRSVAVHEAAHALVGTALGIPLISVSAYGGAGLTSFQGEGNAQHFGTWSLAGSHVQHSWLAAKGFTHPELEPCIIHSGGLGDRLNIERLAADGYTVDLPEARYDLGRLVNSPSMQAAIEDLADHLEGHGSASGPEVLAILESRAVPTPVDVWVPGMPHRQAAATPSPIQWLHQASPQSGISQEGSGATTNGLHRLANKLPPREINARPKGLDAGLAGVAALEPASSGRKRATERSGQQTERAAVVDPAALTAIAAGVSSPLASKPGMAPQRQSPTAVNTRAPEVVPAVSPYKATHGLGLSQGKSL